MKKYLIMLACGIAITVMAQKTELTGNTGFEVIKGDIPVEWMSNTAYKPLGTMKIIKQNAKDGNNCIEINTAKLYSYFALYAKETSKVTVGDKVKLNIYVKGKGRFVFQFYCYNVNGRFLKVFDAKELHKVNSMEWAIKNIEFTIPEFKNAKGESIAKVRPAIFVKPNSILQFDCFSGQISRAEKVK